VAFLTRHFKPKNTLLEKTKTNRCNKGDKNVSTLTWTSLCLFYALLSRVAPIARFYEIFNYKFHIEKQILLGLLALWGFSLANMVFRSYLQTSLLNFFCCCACYI